MTGYMARAKILALMAEQHVTAAQMARRTGVPREFVVFQLGGRRPLTLSELKKIADVLDVPLDELTGGAWFGCPECGGVGPTPTHTRIDCPAANGEELLPAVPR